MHPVVYAQLTYCGLCGEGTYLYLLKETGGVAHCWPRRNVDFVDFLWGHQAQRSQSIDSIGIHTP
jgi:hypothetical protein